MPSIFFTLQKNLLKPVCQLKTAKIVWLLNKFNLRSRPKEIYFFILAL